MCLSKALFGKKRTKNPMLFDSLKDYYNTLKNQGFWRAFFQKAPFF
jgi:hypothetical protein